MALDPAAAARIVESLDRELAKRQSAKDKVQDAQWERECGGDSLILIARRLSRAWDRHLAKPPPALPTSVDDLECAVEDALDYAKSLFALAEAVERAEAHKEAEASGAPRRKPTIIGPRVRAAAPSAKDRVVVDVMAKSDGAPAPHRRSRTEAYLEKQAAEAAARQQMLPPVTARPVQQPAEFWRRGLVLVFEQRASLGVVKFAGLDGFSEAAVLPGVFMASGLTVLTPGMTVDCRLRRNADGSVVVIELRMASGADPQGSAAEQMAADMGRFQIGINRNKWMN